MQPPFDAGNTKEAGGHQTGKTNKSPKRKRVIFWEPCHVAHTDTHSHGGMVDPDRT